VPSRDTHCTEETSVHTVHGVQGPSPGEPSPTLDVPKDPVAGSEPKRKAGRPKRTAKPEEIRALRDSGMSWRQVAKARGIGTATAMRLYSADSGRADTSQNPSLSQPHQTTRPRAADAPEPPLDATMEQSTDDLEQDDSPAPRVRPVKILRRLIPKAGTGEGFPRPIDGRCPGPCETCGGNRWRISVAGFCVCEICHPVRIF
jgi:hypothetical protein